jgi:hypothetical protein
MDETISNNFPMDIICNEFDKFKAGKNLSEKVKYTKKGLPTEYQQSFQMIYLLSG